MSLQTAEPETSRRYRKVRTGVVVSDKMDKTITVSIERHTKHRRFHKGIRRQKKIFAHDANNECHIGDTVQIVETRPLSKNKCWRVQKLVERAAETS